MEPLKYIRLFYPEAKRIEQATGFSAIAMIAQSAGETGWDEPIGNNMFGIKDTDGINGNETLVRTKEFHPVPTKKYPVIHSVTPVVRNGIKMFRYDCEDYFRKYNTPEDSFRDYTEFIRHNNRYSKAVEVRFEPEKYLMEIARAKYATAPNYEEFMLSMINSVRIRLKKLGYENT